MEGPASTVFERLFLDYAGSIRRLALYLTRSEAEAEEIVAETFLRALSAGTRIEGSTAKAYLFTIARNLVQDRRRLAHRETELDERRVPPSPHNADANDEFRRVWTQLQALPENYRIPLMLSACEGLSYEEIGVALNLSLATVKIRIHRARLTLQQSIEEQERTNA
jgi:RNA polymerase sigma-70 factor (ECF subfamily)